jgi:type I restriction enzyme R subunit
MSNFSFIPAQWSTLREAPVEAEQNVYHAPAYAAMLCRKSLEEWIRWLYEHDQDLTLPYDTTLSSLMHTQAFKNLVAPMQFHQINLIRKLGNTAVHTTAKIKPEEALQSLQLLHGFIIWVVAAYNEEKTKLTTFDESLVKKEKTRDKSKDELQVLEVAYLEQQRKLEKLQDELEKFNTIKAHNIAFVPPPTNPNEALTRKIYIDILLREAGWQLTDTNTQEHPLKACMPQVSGNLSDGFVDYVLWGDDGRPLAVVEAKKTKRDPQAGQHQAKLYADGLERDFGQRPVIFYSNGYQSWLWDDLDYAPREIYGFYTKDELQTLIQRRTSKKVLAKETINNVITDRYYQHEAIRKVSEALESQHREALLVMATGTGKTRVAASLIDFLSKANWVKRVLFLADRNALVHQAKINFNDYLPNLPAVDLTQEKEDESSRIVFSTYQTMINLIDGETDGKNRFYSVGHFDLIIFDEIHRSVYNRYKHIFKYFDGFRIGLTATPKAETDKDTYSLFNMQPGNPTYAYELVQAVNDKFLVPPKAIGVPLKFHRNGIKYAELNVADKLSYEEQFTNPLTGEYPDEIDATALNNWLFNTDTVDKVIGHLMENGIHIEGGDKLAKTMLFARSHSHAKFIEQRFNIQYPEYKGDFLKVIDYQEKYKYDLLNKFKDKLKLPQIAVSVDMLDTGIDVPEVCNLVFFKPVRSSSKFWQMIGRGTRLCIDLFAPNEHKREFVIFDFCENFEFFNAHPQGLETGTGKSLSHRLFELRLRMAVLLLSQETDELKDYGHSLISHLVAQTQALDTAKFVVRQHWEVVEKYQDKNQWNSLSDLNIKEIFDHIAILVVETDQDEKAKRFDALMLELQLSVLMGVKRQSQLINKVVATAEMLSKKSSIPLIAVKIETITVIQDKSFWEAATLPDIEKIRLELRDLLCFLDVEHAPIYYTAFEDAFDGQIKEHQVIYNFNDLGAYRKKVEFYLQEKRTHITIHKLTHNIQINISELAELENLLFEQGAIGTKEEFTKVYGEKPLGQFIRGILGLDVNAAKLVFGEILSEQTLNSQQIRFIDTLINFFSVKGIIDTEMLFNPPFTDIDTSGIMGVFDDDMANKIIKLIDQINHNAIVA